MTTTLIPVKTRRYRTLRLPDDYALGPVFVRDGDEAAATLQTWRRMYAASRGHLHRRLKRAGRSPEECAIILEEAADDAAEGLSDIEENSWNEARHRQGALRVADTEQVWVQVDDPRRGLAPLDALAWDALHSLSLCYPVTDDDLAHVARLTGLHRLFIEEGAALTDAGLARLPRLRRLTELALDVPQAGDAGVAVVRRLPALRSLYLHGTGIDVLAPLSGLRRLSELSLLLREPLSDEALPYLQTLPRLRLLWVCPSSLSAAGQQVLRAALPRCVMHLCSCASADGGTPQPQGPALPDGGSVWDIDREEEEDDDEDWFDAGECVSIPDSDPLGAEPRPRGL